MSDVEVLTIVQQMLGVAVKLAAPIMVTALVIGVVISMLQAVTQIQEMTLTFVPKLVGVALVIMFAGNWMLRELVGWVSLLWQQIPTLA